MDTNLESLLDDIKSNIEKRTENTNTKDGAGRDLRNNSVTKSNALSRAYYRFGLVEKRCMEALISKLHPLRNDNFQEIELSATDYAKAFSVSDKTAYRDLSSAVYGLVRRVITTEEYDNKRKSKVEFTLMSKAKYIEDEGRILCIFNPLIVPHLIGYGNGFLVTL